MSVGRPVAIVLDDDDDDDIIDAEPSTPFDIEDEPPIPNLLNIFASDPASSLDICSPATLKVDRKGKGRAVDPPVIRRVSGGSTISNGTGAQRAASPPLFDGIDNEEEEEVPLARKRKLPTNPTTTTVEPKRSKAVPEVSS